MDGMNCGATCFVSGALISCSNLSSRDRHWEPVAAFTSGTFSVCIAFFLCVRCIFTDKKNFLLFVCLQCAYQLAMLLTLHFQGLNILDLYHLKGRNPEHLTGIDKEEYDKAHEILVCMIFNAFVFCQIFNEVNARKPDKFNIFKGFFNNRLFLYVLIFTGGIQILIVEFAGVFASTCHLRWDRWLICVALGLFSWPLAVVVKLFPVPEKPYVSYVLFWRKDEPKKVFGVNSEGDSELTSPGLSGLSSDSSEVSLPLSPYMPREAGFFTRLKYAFFPSTIPDVIVQQPRLKEPNAWA
ncbi:hypothetical protein Mapa_017496 [Marchantia paleacea]|nr:hypothetical protein Mapa_017496 [Marchantia paleacea]